MYHFCIKADKALGADLGEQLEACARLRIQNIEIDAICGGESLDGWDGGRVEDARNLLISNLQRIVLLGCDFLGFDERRANVLFRRAMALGVETVNCVVPETVAGIEALGRMLAAVLPVARSYGIGVALENRRASPLAHEEALSALFREYRQYEPGLVFNPLEFAAERRHPFFHVFYNSRLKGAVRFLRVNDGLFADGSPSLPAAGNAEIKEMASALLARGFTGYFSFHQYLPGMDVRMYIEVIERFKGLLREM